MNVSEALKLITEEYNRANGAYPMFNSAHEGYAVLLEEVEELWDEIKHDNVGRLRPEAVQVAAMALKFIVSCCAGDAPEDIPPCDSKHFCFAASQDLDYCNGCECIPDQKPPCECEITGPTYQGSGNHKGLTMCQLCGRPARLGK